MDLKFIFVGWYKEDTHDKVWALIELTEFTNLSVWGRRGTKLRCKIIDNYDGYRQISYKKRKGYKTVHSSELHEIDPNLKSDLEKLYIINRLKI